MSTATKILTALVVAEAAALGWLARDLHRLHESVDLEELHGLALDQKFAELRQNSS